MDATSSHTPQQKLPAICFVTDDLVGFRRHHEPCTDLWLTGKLLATRGWKVHWLYVGPEEDTAILAEVSHQQARAGISLSKLGDFEVPKVYRIFQATPDTSGTVQLSNILRFALEALNSIHHFDAIEFESGRGLGLRTVQAKRAGLAFGNTELIVKLHGPGPWLRERNKSWDSPNDLLLDYCERYTFEHADTQLCTSAIILETARGLGWNIKPDVGVLSARENSVVADTYSRILLPRDSQKQASGSREPLVTLGVTHHNLGAYLPETLASLSSQTYPNCEILVVDDGSTCPESLRVFTEQERLYPRFRFIRQSNQGPGAARNLALSEGKGEYFIPVDADNIARPSMVHDFVRGMFHNPDCSVMTSFCLAFQDSGQISRGDFLYLSCPTGGPHMMACVFNVYGDTNAIFRSQDLRAVGGFASDRRTCCEDWETFVKMVNAGYRLAVIPEPLYYYRRRKDSLSGVMSKEWTDFYPFIRRLLEEFFVNGAHFPEGERRALWSALASYLVVNDGVCDHLGFTPPNQSWERLRLNKPLRYRIVDSLNDGMKRIPLLQRVFKAFFL